MDSKFEVFNPYTQTRLGSYCYAQASEIEATLLLMSQYKSDPAFFDRARRVQNLRELKTHLLDQKKELAYLITQSMGKPLTQSIAEIEKSCLAIDYACENVQTKSTPSEKLPEGFEQRAEGLGPLLAILPWNFPVWQLMRILPWNYLMNNPILHKSSDLVAPLAEKLNHIVNTHLGEAFFKGLFLDHDQVASIIRDHRISAVTLTGSTRAGSKVAAIAGEALKKCVLELGGSDPFILGPGADLKQAVRAGVRSRLVNAGQSCIAAKRFFIHETLYASFLMMLKNELAALEVGNPMEMKTEMGPLASSTFALELAEDLEALKKQGAKEIGVEYPDITKQKALLSSAFVLPRIFEVEGFEEMVKNHEFFGPVFLLAKYTSVEELLTKANHSAFGLAASVWGYDNEDYSHIARGLECGFVVKNDWVKSDPALPFGGVKQSGYGKEMGALGFREFSNLKIWSQ